MPEWEVGDRIRIDIPDETDPDHDRLHGQPGEVVEIIEDHAESVTGDDRDSRIYRIELDAGGEETVRWHDLRPP